MTPRVVQGLIVRAYAPDSEEIAMFPLGQIVATPNALDTLARHGRTPAEFLARHVAGDWQGMSP